MIRQSRGEAAVMWRLWVAATFIPAKGKLDGGEFVKHIEGLKGLKGRLSIVKVVVCFEIHTSTFFETDSITKSKQETVYNMKEWIKIEGVDRDLVTPQTCVSCTDTREEMGLDQVAGQGHGESTDQSGLAVPTTTKEWSLDWLGWQGHGESTDLCVR